MPYPIPRNLPIVFTAHAEKRCKMDRFIHLEHVSTAIRLGREFPTAEIGEFGGSVSKFSKSFFVHLATGPVTTTVVAVCEVFADKYIVLTADHLT